MPRAGTGGYGLPIFGPRRALIHIGVAPGFAAGWELKADGWRLLELDRAQKFLSQVKIEPLQKTRDRVESGTCRAELG